MLNSEIRISHYLRRSTAGILLLWIFLALGLRPAHAQDLEMRRANGAGNWLGYVNNNGSLFNQSDSNHPSQLRLGAGGIWTGDGTFDTVVFGAGLWIGGLRDRSGVLTPHSEFSYSPNSAQSEFAPGSLIYDGAATDTAQTARDRYRVYRSGDLVGPPWPLRLIGGKAAYIDDPAQRADAGPKAIVGDEDMFLVYKDSDPDSITDPFGLEVRTTASFWKSGMLKNVVLAHNEIIYSGHDTIFDPVVALALDGDINNPDDDRTKGVHDETTTASIFFTNASTSDPLLGVLGLGGQYGPHRVASGITSLRYWYLDQDPVTDSDRYAFLTQPNWDTALTVPGDARILLSSLSNAPLIPGDTLDFDYALYAEPPIGAALSAADSAAMINIAQTILLDYQTGAFRPTASVEKAVMAGQLFAWPDPATSTLNFVNSQGTLSLYDPLGRLVKTTASRRGVATLDVRELEPGIYFVRSTNTTIPVAVQH